MLALLAETLEESRKSLAEKSFSDYLDLENRNLGGGYY